MTKLKKYINRIIKLVKLDEMEILPGHLAFYLIFIIIPVLSFIGIICNNINIDLTNTILNNSIPNAVLDLIIGSVNSNYNNYNIIVFLIISLYLASRGTKAIIVSSNLLFKIKEKNIIKIRIKAILMTIILFILIGFMVIVPVLGDIIINYLTGYLKENISVIIINIYHLLKNPISLILMFLLIKFLYTMASSNEISNKYMNNGAIWTTIMWFILSRIYSYYLNNYNNYNLYYGNLSNILILFVWIYLLSYIWTIGLALNADNYLTDLKTQNK